MTLPLILAKALYKLADPYATGVSQDPSVLLRLTSWLPEVVPISETLPIETAWGVLSQYNERSPYDRMAATALMTAADASEDDLSAVGLCHGPLLAVHDAREVNGDLYARLESRLLQWTGPLRDTDEASWSPSLADGLSWKRLQRLSIRAAGIPQHDLWLSMPPSTLTSRP